MREFHEQAEALGLDGAEVLRQAEALDDEPEVATRQLTPAEVLQGTSRAALRRASASVVRAGRGLVVEHGPGFDPNNPDPRKAWWAKAKMTGGRAVATLTVEGHANAIEALDALADAVGHRARQLHRRR